jgi:hypothetical protein
MFCFVGFALRNNTSKHGHRFCFIYLAPRLVSHYKPHFSPPPAAVSFRQMNTTKYPGADHRHKSYLYPDTGTCRVKRRGLLLRAKGVTACCLVRDIAHLVGRWEMGLHKWWNDYQQEKTEKLELKPAPWPLHASWISPEPTRDWITWW